jgi:hypothetical protein
MAKAFKYLLGMWTGASVIAFGVACGMLYFLTGKLPVMSHGRPRLVAAGEAIARTRALVEKAMGKSNEPIL